MMKEEKIQCRICEQYFKNIQGLSTHIIHMLKKKNKLHNNITVKEYYNKYYKKDTNEGYCPTCKKETTVNAFWRHNNTFHTSQRAIVSNH